MAGVERSFRHPYSPTCPKYPEARVKGEHTDSREKMAVEVEGGAQGRTRETRGKWWNAVCGGGSMAVQWSHVSGQCSGEPHDCRALRSNLLHCRRLALRAPFLLGHRTKAARYPRTESTGLLRPSHEPTTVIQNVADSHEGARGSSPAVAKTLAFARRRPRSTWPQLHVRPSLSRYPEFGATYPASSSRRAQTGIASPCMR